MLIIKKLLTELFKEANLIFDTFAYDPLSRLCYKIKISIFKINYPRSKLTGYSVLKTTLVAENIFVDTQNLGCGCN